MAIDMKDTISLMQAMERIKAPATTLVDTFFPNIPTPAVTSKIMVEYRKGNRRLAPFVVDGIKLYALGRYTDWAWGRISDGFEYQAV